MQPDPLTPEASPKEEPVETPPPREESYPELRQIRTFQGDVASTIGEEKQSIVSIQRKAQARRAEQAPSIEEMEGKEDRKDVWKVALLSLGTLLLVGGGVVGGWYAYTQYREKTELPVISVPKNRLITSAKTVELASLGLTRANLIEKIAEEEKSTPSGQVTHISIEQTAREFLETLEARAPGRLLRAFDDTFMLGTLGGESPSVFLIVKLTSYENAFAGMLEWESIIAEDLGPIFSTRLALRDLDSEPVFQDVVNRNKDSRALRMALPTAGEVSTTTSATTSPQVATATTTATSTGGTVTLGEPETVLVYSFFDQNTLIITDSDEALASILGRLSSELLSR